LAEIKTIKAGAVIIKDKPFYYVEEISVAGSSVPYIAVYDISKESLNRYNAYHDYSVLYKRVYHKKIKRSRVLGLTNLSKLVTGNKDRLTEEHVQTLMAKPIFITEEEPGTDSFSNDYGMGFMELAKNPNYDTKLGSSDNDSMPPYLVPTGVFIGVKNIVWQKEYIPVSGLTSYLSDLIDANFGMPSIDVFGG
jgi:hypothetical protein